MNITGDIHVTVTRNQFGSIDNYDFEWRGGPICRITDIMLDEILAQGQQESFVKTGRLWIGPYRLREIEDADRYMYGARTFCRDDRLIFRLIPIAFRVSELARIAYHRLIVTLAIWGFAEYHQAVVPSWREVYLVQKIRKFLKP